MRSWESFDWKIVRIKPVQVQVMSFWTKMFSSWPHTFIIHFKCIKCVCQANPVYSMLSTKDHSTFSLKPLLSTYLKYITNQASIDNHQGFFYFNLFYLIVCYFNFIYFTSDLLTLFIRLWSYTELLKLYISFNYSILSKLQRCEDHLLITHAYNTFMKQCRGLVYRFLLCESFIKSQHGFQVKLHSKDFRYVHWLYLQKSEHVCQNYDILVSITMKQ